jgi:hypothetical protein
VIRPTTLAFGSLRAPRRLLALAAALLLGVPGSARADRFEMLELGPQDVLLGFALVDLDGDKRVDPVLAAARKVGPDARERFLNVYRPAPAKDGQSYAYGPARELRVPDDVVAFGVADLLGKGKAQLVYFTARSVFAVDPQSGAPTRVLESERVFAPLAAPDDLPNWDGFDDLDRDGRTDLLLPALNGYHVYLQKQPGKLTAAGQVIAGSSYRHDPLTRRMRRMRDQTSFATGRAVNRMVLADVNGDKRTDLIGMKDKDLLAFEQRADGSYLAEPSARFRLVGPRGIPFEELALDAVRPPPNIEAGDVDKDGRTDYVVPEIDVRELVMRLRIFLATSKGVPEQPTQILKLSSIGDEPELVDINGDGHLDIGVGTVRTDRLLSLAQPTVKSIDFTYYGFLYRPAEKRFSTRPDISRDVSYELPEEKKDEERSRTATATEEEEEDEEPAGFLRLGGDFDSDGVKDLALMRATGELSIYRGDAGRDRMSPSLASEPMIEAKVKATNNAWILDLDADGRSDFVFRHEDSLQILVSRK